MASMPHAQKLNLVPTYFHLHHVLMVLVSALSSPIYIGFCLVLPQHELVWLPFSVLESSTFDARSEIFELLLSSVLL